MHHRGLVLFKRREVVLLQEGKGSIEDGIKGQRKLGIWDQKAKQSKTNIWGLIKKRVLVCHAAWTSGVITGKNLWEELQRSKPGELEATYSRMHEGQCGHAS